MNRNLIFITVGLIVAVTIAMIFFYNNGEVDKKGKEVVMQETEESANKEAGDVMIAEEYEKYFSDAKFITVSKVVRTIEERPDGETFTTYEEYMVSDIDFETNADFTEDYSKAMAGTEFHAELVKKDSFENVFGFSYKEKDAWQIYKELLMLNSVSGDFEKATLDEATYDITKQRLYEFTPNEALWEHMLEGLVYDEIIESKVTYQVEESEGGVLYPDCFVATVVYTDAGWKVTKSMFLQVTVNR